MTFGHGARLITGLTGSRMSSMDAVSRKSDPPDQEESEMVAARLKTPLKALGSKDSMRRNSWEARPAAQEIREPRD